MSVSFGENLVVRHWTWTQVKTYVDAYNGRLQYEDEGTHYTIWAKDDGSVFTCTIYKDDVPYGVVNGGYSQAQNDADKTEFLAGYEPAANRPTNVFQKDRAAIVAITGTEGNEVIYATHNFCDETTWYGDSERITDATLVDSGDGLTWTSDHPNWINMVSGLILDEDGLRQDVEHGYEVVVTVNNVQKTRRESYETTGGDYAVNWADGTITFFNSQTGQTVKASYSHATTSTWYLRPGTGKAIDIIDAEAQFSIDVDMQDTLRFGVWGYVQVFAPAYWEGNGGPLPTDTKVELQSQRYMRRNQMVDEARGAYPVIPASGGSTRGAAQDITGFPFQYEALRRLYNMYGMELRLTLEHNRKFLGEHATATFYMRSRNESEL